MGCINPFCTALLKKGLEQGLPLSVCTHRHTPALSLLWHKHQQNFPFLLVVRAWVKSCKELSVCAQKPFLYRWGFQQLIYTLLKSAVYWLCAWSLIVPITVIWWMLSARYRGIVKWLSPKLLSMQRTYDMEAIILLDLQTCAETGILQGIFHYILMLVWHMNMGKYLHLLQMEIFTIFLLFAFYNYLQTLPDLTQ